MNRSLTVARVFFAIVAAYHLLLGTVLFYSGELALRLADLLYGWTIEGSPTLGIAGEILGCYFIAFGLMMAVAARDPAVNRACVTVGIVLVALRLAQRLVFSEKVMEVFQVPSGRYWLSFLLVLLMGALMVLFRWQIGRRAPAAATA